MAQPKERTYHRAPAGYPVEGPGLPQEDVRERLDQAVRRGWMEIAWRALRFGILLLVDAVAGTAAIGTLWFGFGLGPDLNPALLLPSIALIQPLALGVAGAYGPSKRRRSSGRLATGSVLAVALVAVQVTILNGVDHGRLALFCAGYLALVLVLLRIGRLGVDRVVNAFRRRGIGQKRLLVVGTEEQAAELARELDDRRDLHSKIVARLSPHPVGRFGEEGTLAGLEGAVEQHGVAGVIVDSTLTFEELELLVHRCFDLGISVMLLPKKLGQLSARLQLRTTNAGAMLEVEPEALGVPQMAVKRLLDVVASTLLLVVTAPLWMAIAAAIKLSSPGPVLFSQTRAGVGGRPFQMHKFRTMVEDADRAKQDLQHLNESGDPRLFKIKDDPRVTRVGRFLRRFSLDEIPQVLNVLRGEMSLVGPRPFFPEDMGEYEDHHLERLWMLPGITGLWQVSGRSDVVDFEEVVRLDREYIREWSLWKDLSIVIRTIPAALKRNGAY